MPRHNTTHPSPKMKQRGPRPTQSPRDNKGHKYSNNNNNNNMSSQDSEDTESSILAKFSRAKELESDLNNLTADQKSRRKPSSSIEEKASAVRLQLCQLLSDLLLTDPAISQAQDAIGRTWKYCFYGRINEIRSRIVKEKSRAKKRQAAGGGGGGSVASSQTSSENIVEDLEKQLKTFLNEAIALYEYLIEKYVKMLIPMSQASSVMGSQDTQDDASRQAIVAILYRMHIHLGDLHRYSLSNKQAEECYLKAAKLAPATGNPYNQLAVISQGQESLTMVALYYYTRSLMATYQPFETSRPNLVRLFETNRKWLDEHSRNNDSHNRMLVGGNINAESSMGKKAQKEWFLKEKSAMNRKFLAQMVDLQWDFFKGVSLDGSDNKVDLNDLLMKMSSILDLFETLLGNSTFSESLTCKIIAILAFSALSAGNDGKLCSTKGLSAKREKDPNWNEGVTMTNQALAFSFVLRFCTVLANRLEMEISKQESKSNSSGLGIIRSLPPLLLGFSFVTSIYSGSDFFHGLVFFPVEGNCDDLSLEKNSVRELCSRSHREFWGSIANISNHLDALSKGSPQEKKSFSLEDVKEYSEYHGFSPFHAFLNKSGGGSDDENDRKSSEFVSAEVAVSALSSGKLTAHSKLGDVETKVKIRVLLASVENITASSETMEIDTESGKYFLVRDKTTGSRKYYSKANPGTPAVVEMQTTSSEEVSKEKGDDMEGVVVLQTSYSRTGVPLLVPGNIMGTKTNEKPLDPASMNPEKHNPSTADLLGSVLASNVSTENNQVIAQTNENITINSLNKTDIGMMLGLPEIPATAATATPNPPKVALPPPPGFPAQLQPQPERHQQTPLIQPNLSMGNFTTANHNRSAMEVSHLPALNQLHKSTLPQSSPAYTMNPFAQTSVPGNGASHTILAGAQTSGVDLNSISWGQATNRPYGSRSGLDPTLDFMLTSNGACSSNGLVTSDAHGPSPEDQSSSLLKFLFETDNESLQASPHNQHSNSSAASYTRNPFAT